MTKSIACTLAASLASCLVLAQEPPKSTGWTSKPGAGLIFEGDAFSLEWRNRLQVHGTYTNNENAADVTNFTVRRARTMLSGHVFSKNILYYLMFDAVDTGAAGGYLKQGWAQWNFVSSDSSKIGLRFGQAKTMFGMEATNTSGGLWFVERSSASRSFADAFSRGAWVNGVAADNRLRWVAGAMNTDSSNALGAGYVDRGEETANSDNELSYVLNANFDVLGDFHDGRQTIEAKRAGDWRTDDRSLKGTIGVGCALGNGKDAANTPPGQDIETTSLNLNTAWTVAGWSLMGEYFQRTDDLQGPVADKEQPEGFAVSGAYLLAKTGGSAIQWGFGVRMSRVEIDEGTPGSGVDYLTGSPGIGTTIGECTELSAVINAFYYGHQCKTQLEYTRQEVDPDSAAATSLTNHILRIAFQIEF